MTLGRCILPLDEAWFPTRPAYRSQSEFVVDERDVEHSAKGIGWTVAVCRAGQAIPNREFGSRWIWLVGDDADSAAHRS